MKKVIIGLGNPGEKYKNNRHNVGFMVLDQLTQELDLGWENSKKFNSQFIKDSSTIYAKPQTMMNNSGIAVEAIMSYYKLLPKKMGILKKKNADLSDILTIIHDDLDIELGKYKISIDSRSAGHRGIGSIINQLKTKNFKRIRIGIKTPDLEQIPAKAFVLQNFMLSELKIINDLMPDIFKTLSA